MFRITLLTLLLSCSLTAQNIVKQIKQRLLTLPKSSIVSMVIMNADDNIELFSKNSNRAMIPASNTKLFTTAAALKIMGPDRKIPTTIYTDDLDYSDTVVDGNLYIKGFGNPTFTHHDLDTLVKEIKQLGIRRITGDIIGDDSYFDNFYTRDDWIINERSNVNLPPVSALVINKNQITIKLKSNGKIGSKLKYSITPESSFITVNMSAKVSRGRSYPKFRTSFSEKGIVINVTKGMRKRRSPRYYAIEVKDPPLFASLLLKERLIKKGIKVDGNSIKGITPNNATILASKSITVNELISLINKTSNNFMAECLFKSLGAFFSGMQGNSFYATQAIQTTFEENNIIDDNSVIVDGSGISRFNTITTNSITKLLHHIYKNPVMFKDYYKSFAISGIDGTLKDRPINDFIRGNFHGKTGTLNGVSALSGYLTNRDNKTYIVSIITEFKVGGMAIHKKFEDDILDILTR